MSMKVDPRLEQYLRRLTQLDRALPRIAHQVQGEALAFAMSAANLNIYSSAPGAYERTGAYLRGLDARGRTMGPAVSVSVSNNVEYAAFVEFGRDNLSPAALQQAAALNPAPLTVGRSGQNWWVAGPVLISAQAHAARRLRELFIQEIRKATR